MVRNNFDPIISIVKREGVYHGYEDNVAEEKHFIDLSDRQQPFLIEVKPTERHNEVTCVDPVNALDPILTYAVNEIKKVCGH